MLKNMSSNQTSDNGSEIRSKRNTLRDKDGGIVSSDGEPMKITSDSNLKSGRASNDMDGGDSFVPTTDIADGSI